MPRKPKSIGSQLAALRWAKPGADRDQPRQAGKLGGRPVKLILCPRGCGHQCGVVAMRQHSCVPTSSHPK